MEKPNLYESLKILRESGILLEKKLRSEMTPEELADARAKSKKRREARKLAAAEKRGYEKAMHDHMTADYKPAQAKEPEAKEPEANPDKSKEVPKYDLGSWEDFRANGNDPDFLKYLDRAKSIDRYLAEKFEDVVFNAWRKNVPISNIRKILKDCYIADLSSDERREYGY